MLEKKNKASRLLLYVTHCKVQKKQSIMSVEAYDDDEFPTCVVHILPIKTAEINPVFVWIPGNPGILEYYQEMLINLHEKHPTWEILAISHIGMNTKTTSLFKGSHQDNSRVFTLKEQIQHKIKIINNFVKDSNVPIYISGHSVGAYMVQKIVASDELIGQVLKMGLITPTIIDIHLSEKGKSMTRYARWSCRQLPHILSFLCYIVFGWLVPGILRSYIIGYVMGCHHDSQAAISTELFLTGPNFVRQSLGLAQEEMDTIHDDWQFQAELIEYCLKNSIKIQFLFSATDHWVREATRKEIIQFYQERCKGAKALLKIDVSDQFPHSFVVRLSLIHI